MFEEIVGELHTIEHSGGLVYVRLSTGTLRFEDSSRKAEICRQNLAGHEGDRVGILRTTLTEEPLVVRIAD